ncbi:tetratricopeptide repeat protein [Halobacteriovorax sp. RZ-2]|uniref:tetratricopeptide repeat protein n=1 Tax=unclassified Halobacteriovorax TaxID=2639665 RepID=UPI0037237F52
MKKTSLLTTITLTTLMGASMTSCKTQEQIEREQKINTMSVQMQQNQKLNADSVSKMQELQDSVLQFQGQLEEYTNGKDQKLETVDQKLLKLEEQNTALTDEVTKLTAKIEEQDKFIKEVLALLKKKESKRKELAKAKNRSPYNQAMFLYGKGKYSEARPILEKLFKEGKIKGKRRGRIIHNLGMISYIQKRNDDAVTYFSTLYTSMPSSAYNGNGLVYLARTFKRQGQTEQAIVTLEEMLKSFPKSRHVPTAKKLLASYKK